MYLCVSRAGQRPVIVARGGFSGLVPDSSQMGYELIPQMSLPDTVFYCDLQLSKDSVGFCLSGLKLDNSTNISLLYPEGKKTYTVNGEQTTGWFAIDYFGDDLLAHVTCK